MSLHCYEVCMALQVSRGAASPQGPVKFRKSFEGSILFSMHCHRLSDAHAKAPPPCRKISEQHLCVSPAFRGEKDGTLIYMYYGH